MAIIYCIQNKINQKRYIGETLFSLESRFKEHLRTWRAPRKRDEKRPLYMAFSKYGIENFDYYILEECEDIKRWEREKYWIQQLNTCGSTGYNANTGGIGNDKFSFTDEEVINKYLECGYIIKTAEYFDCSPETIKRRLIKNNIKTIHAFTERKIEEEDKQNILKMYFIDKKTLTYIAQIYETTSDTISRNIKNWGYKTETHRNRIKGFGQENAIIALYKELKSITQVAKIFNYDFDTIKKILVEYNIPLYSSSESQKHQVVGILTDGSQKFFNSYADAGRWCIENNYSGGTANSVAINIGRSCSGKRKPVCYGIKWEKIGV